MSTNHKTSVSVNLGRNLTLKNPVILASGTASYGEELSSILDISRLGGIVTKAISREAREGNLPQRIVETPCGMLNAIGLTNIGINSFIQKMHPFLKRQKTCTIVNVVGKSIDDYCYVIERLESLDKGIDGYEINLSCPNVKNECIIFGVDAQATARIVSKLRSITSRHLMIKLTPNVTSIATIAKAAEDSGADSISLINTVVGLSVNYKTKQPHLNNVTGGLSGPAIKPIALAKIWEAKKAVNLPIVGMGGISSFEDAMEFFLVGATAIQIGTYNFIMPTASINISRKIEEFFILGEDTFENYVGSMKLPSSYHTTSI